MRFLQRLLLITVMFSAISFCGCAWHPRHMPTYLEPAGYSSTYDEYLHEFDPTVAPRQ